MNCWFFISNKIIKFDLMNEILYVFYLNSIRNIHIMHFLSLPSMQHMADYLQHCNQQETKKGIVYFCDDGPFWYPFHQCSCPGIHYQRICKFINVCGPFENIPRSILKSNSKEIIHIMLSVSTNLFFVCCCRILFDDIYLHK